MNINDFIDLCIDAGLLTVEIYSMDRSKIVWTGPGDEIPEEFLYCELWSWDVPTKPDCITLNID